MPGKDPTQCQAKRPISLINCVIKALEAVVLDTIKPPLDPTISKAQYVYRAARGAEFQLLEVFDFAQSHTKEERLVDLASLDIDGTFDKVPHDKLTKTLRSLDVEPYLFRFIEGWV